MMITQPYLSTDMIPLKSYKRTILKQALTEVLRICTYPTNEIFNIIGNVE